MAIEALYPSRRQSKRHNPLFARERRRKRIMTFCALGFGLFCMAGLRFPPGPAHAGFIAHRTHMVSATPKRQIRIIPLYNIPSEQGNAPIHG